MYDTAIFDIDGTLVDSSYQHALTWYRAFRTCDLTIPVWQLHRDIGMGGDLLVALVAGEQQKPPTVTTSAQPGRRRSRS